MIIDGKALAAKWQEEISLQLAGQKVRLDLILVGDNPASKTFVRVKQKFGEAIGVEVRIYEYEENVPQTDLESLITRLSQDPVCRGIVIQLPLPKHLDEEKLLSLIPANKDVDALSSETKVLSPVAKAIEKIFNQNQVNLIGKKIVVLGKGKLVGRPVAIWLTQEGAKVEITDSKTQNLPDMLATADVVISGIGRPQFIKPTMIKTGVILIDAGTSESSGKLAGDADPACAEKCSIFTPVPGGVGPLTVAGLFQNLVDLVRM